MTCTVCAHISPWSMRGVHDNGCGSVTDPVVALCAMTNKGARLPVAIVSEAGAVQVNTDGPNCFGGATVVGAGDGEVARVVAGAAVAGGTESTVAGWVTTAAVGG